MHAVSLGGQVEKTPYPHYMSNEGLGRCCKYKFLPWDLFFPSCIPSTSRKKDGQHYVVAYENKHLHGFVQHDVLQYEGQASILDKLIFLLPPYSLVKLLSNRNLSTPVALKKL